MANWTWRGRVGLLLLAFWMLIAGLIGVGVPLGALAVLLPWLLLVGAVCIFLGI